MYNGTPDSHAGRHPPPDAGTNRRPARAGRQERVGILPNPNRTALPPPHRPPLIGRWMRLRSSRRPAAPEAEPSPTEAGGQPEQGVILGQDGRIARIDLDLLARSVQPRDRPASQLRAGFADHLRQPASRTPAALPAALPEAAAPETNDPPPAGPMEAPRRPAWHSWRDWLLARLARR